MSVLNKVKHYQRKIERNKENSEGLIDCINKLSKLPVKVRHLEKTGIGKTINALRKIDGDVGNVAKALVWKWKRMVIAEAVAEEKAEKERRLRDPTVSSTDENFPNSKTETDEEQASIEEDSHSTLSLSAGNDANAEMLQETCEEECTSSTANQNFTNSKYDDGDEDDDDNDGDDDNNDDDDDNDHTYDIQPTMEGEDSIPSPEESTSHPLPLNEDSPKEKEDSTKEKDYHGHHHHHHHHHHRHHNSKHHSHSKRDKPRENKKKSKCHDKVEASLSQSKTKEDKDVDCESGKINVKFENMTESLKHEQEDKKFESMGSSSKGKHHSKRSENGSKSSERKHHHKDGGQKRKSDHEVHNESIPKHSKSSEKAKKAKTAVAEDDGIDCFSGASFAEALGMGDTMKKKKLNTSTTYVMGNSLSGSTSGTKTTYKPYTLTRPTIPTKPDLLLEDVKLEPLDMEVDVTSTLPEISPNYKPLPQVPSSSKPRKGRPITEEAAALNQVVTQVILSKYQRQRTKVYSGVKTGGPIPTLYDLCVHVLKENIDALEYTGGVPYDILKPILQQATPEQLYQLEQYNPYLVEDTDELWDFHCRKEFRTSQRQPMETAREMYLRCLDEREAKLKALTSNIQQSLAKSAPVRQTKLAYVDSVAKPPRYVARQQAKYGTGSIPKSNVNKAEKKASSSKPSTSGASSSVSQRPTHTASRVKPRMAPLMQKTLKLAKSFKR